MQARRWARRAAGGCALENPVDMLTQIRPLGSKQGLF